MTIGRRNLMLVFLFSSLRSLSVGQASQKVPTADVVIPAVVQAVEDEIYDLNEEGKYFLIDDQGSGDRTPATISIYISKDISANGDGIAVYKLMPYGEVYRYFVVRDDGLVVLQSDPHHGFLPIGGSVLTVYMSADDVSDFIVHRSIKSAFVVDPAVSNQRLHDAIQRQLKRTGFSYRRYFAQHSKKK
jgi:hypothetical protein